MKNKTEKQEHQEMLALSLCAEKTGTLRERLYEHRIWIYAMVAILVVMVLMVEPAHAQAWATKANNAANQIVTGLKMLGRTVATLVGLWGALMMISGRKRFSDLWEWFVGAGVFLAIGELVELFFNGS